MNRNKGTVVADIPVCYAVTHRMLSQILSFLLQVICCSILSVGRTEVCLQGKPCLCYWASQGLYLVRQGKQGSYVYPIEDIFEAAQGWVLNLFDPKLIMQILPTILEENDCVM